MEDVLDLYAQPYAACAPVVCFDETNKQLVQETRLPWPVEAGQPARYDYEYERNGVANLFMSFQPLTGWRHVEVTEHRTKHDFADQMKQLVDVRFPTAIRIRVVLDNLNTHTKGALYEAFEPQEAKRIADRLEFHYTPKHGSWLNMAEIELSVLTKQCLDRRIADAAALEGEVGAWEAERNEQHATVNWRFKVADARTKLKRLYPNPNSS
jgi:DDE superfamily endonuclease